MRYFSALPRRFLRTGLPVALAVFTLALTGCYTQLQTMEADRGPVADQYDDDTYSDDVQYTGEQYADAQYADDYSSHDPQYVALRSLYERRYDAGISYFNYRRSVRDLGYWSGSYGGLFFADPLWSSYIPEHRFHRLYLGYQFGDPFLYEPYFLRFYNLHFPYGYGHGFYNPFHYGSSFHLSFNFGWPYGYGYRPYGYGYGYGANRYYSDYFYGRGAYYGGWRYDAPGVIRPRRDNYKPRTVIVDRAGASRGRTLDGAQGDDRTVVIDRAPRSRGATAVGDRTEEARTGRTVRVPRRVEVPERTRRTPDRASVWDRIRRAHEDRGDRYERPERTRRTPKHERPERTRRTPSRTRTERSRSPRVERSSESRSSRGSERSSRSRSGRDG